MAVCVIMLQHEHAATLIGSMPILYIYAAMIEDSDYNISELKHESSTQIYKVKMAKYCNLGCL